MADIANLYGWATLWLSMRLLVRQLGHSVDLDDASHLAHALAPLRLPFTLISAYNPAGIPRAIDLNRRAHRELQASLDAAGLFWLPALGRTRDGSWAEPGFVVGGLTVVEAAALGRAWGQLAVFHVTENDVQILASDDSFHLRRSRG